MSAHGVCDLFSFAHLDGLPFSEAFVPASFANLVDLDERYARAERAAKSAATPDLSGATARTDPALIDGIARAMATFVSEKIEPLLQGFALERGAYLADFYLPQQGIWVEVKGPPPSFEEEDLCQYLAVETRQPVIITWGQPSWEGVVICFTPDGDRQLIALSGFLLRWASVNTLTKAIKAARSARWEHGERPKIPKLSAANTP